MTQKIRKIDHFLYRLTGLLRCRIIQGNEGEAYLERYHLFRLPGGGGAYIHRFLSSDPDRGLHDHPWRHALGLVLAGGYQEQRLCGDHINERTLTAGSFNRINGKDFHRIILPTNHQAWTFFIHTGKIGDWGFLNLNKRGNREFQPHNKVNNEGSHDKWWKTAARGKHAPREPLDTHH